MSTEMIIEMIGYTGSFLVLVSFLMVSVFKLRVVNTIGSVIFTTYALIIHSYPTAIMNICLVGINIYYLMKMRSTEKNYDLVKTDIKDGILKYVIESNSEDIQKCFPGISLDFDNANCGFAVLHNGKPVGIMLGTLEGHTLDIQLDYSIPEYRDFSIGKFLMSNLVKQNIDKLIYKGSDENHKEYLKNVGFVAKDGYYEKVL